MLAKLSFHFPLKYFEHFLGLRFNRILPQQFFSRDYRVGLRYVTSTGCHSKCFRVKGRVDVIFNSALRLRNRFDFDFEVGIGEQEFIVKTYIAGLGKPKAIKFS